MLNPHMLVSVMAGVTLHLGTLKALSLINSAVADGRSTTVSGPSHNSRYTENSVIFYSIL